MIALKSALATKRAWRGSRSIDQNLIRIYLNRRSRRAAIVAERLRYYNEQYPVTYRRWFDSLYKDKYYYMGDADLMSAALLLDVSSYYVPAPQPSAPASTEMCEVS